MDGLRKFVEDKKNIVVVIVLGVLTLIPVLFIKNDSPQINYLVGWFIWIVTLIAQRIENVNLFLNRIWLWFLNKSVSWTIKGEFSAHLTDSTVGDLVNDIITEFPDARSWHRENDNAIIHIPKIGGNVRIYITNIRKSENDFSEVLIVDFSNLYVPFRQSKKSLNLIISLFDHVIKSKIQTKKEKYTLKVKFGETNPYFGLFVNRFKVHQQDLVTFLVTFTEKEDLEQGNIQIGIGKLSLVAHSLNSLRIFSEKYISLSSVELFKS